MEILYNNTKLNINICKIIDKYYILRTKLYTNELLFKTQHINRLLNYQLIGGYKISHFKNDPEYVWCLCAIL